jgi:hypothetical protein
VEIHCSNGLGTLLFATGTANRVLSLACWCPGDPQICPVAVTLLIKPGEYAVTSDGRLTVGSPEPGLLHDRLELLSPLVVTRAYDA